MLVKRLNRYITQSNMQVLYESRQNTHEKLPCKKTPNDVQNKIG